MICENNFTLTETIEILKRAFSDEEVDNIIFTAIKDTSWNDENLAIIYIDSNKTFTIVKSNDDILATTKIKKSTDEYSIYKEIFNNGYTVMEIRGSDEYLKSINIQEFVEELSYKIGYKCEFIRCPYSIIVRVESSVGRDRALDVLSNTDITIKYKI